MATSRRSVVEPGGPLLEVAALGDAAGAPGGVEVAVDEEVLDQAKYCGTMKADPLVRPHIDLTSEFSIRSHERRRLDIAVL
jgi:hypothetical protein